MKRHIPWLMSLFLLCSLFPSISHATNATSYVMEYPLIQSENIADYPKKPTPSDTRTRTLLFGANLSAIGVWLSCQGSSSCQVELWNMEGTTLHNTVTGVPSDKDKYKHLTLDHRYVLYQGNDNKTYKLDVINGTTTQILDSVPGTIYGLNSTYVLLHYTNGSGNSLRGTLKILNYNNGTLTTFGPFNLNDENTTNTPFVSKSPDGQTVYIGQNMMDNDSQSETFMKVWEFKNGTATEKLNTAEFEIYRNNSHDYDLESNLAAFNNGFYVSYLRFDDEDDYDYEGTYFYVNNGSATTTYNCSDDETPSRFITDDHVGLACTKENPNSTSYFTGSKIYNRSTGAEVFAATTKRWSGSTDSSDTTTRYNAYAYNESTKNLYMHYQRREEGWAPDVSFYKYNLNTGQRIDFYTKSGILGQPVYVTKDKTKWVFGIYFFDGGTELYWVNLTDDSIHYVLKSTALNIDYSTATNEFFTILADEKKKVLFSPFVSAQNVQDIVDDALEGGTIENGDLQLIKDAVMDGSGNTALSVANEVKSLLSNGGEIYNLLQGLQYPPEILAIKGKNGVPTTTSSNFIIRTYYASASHYRYSLNNGIWTGWTTLASSDGYIDIPLNNLQEGMNIVQVRLKNGSQTTLGRMIFYKTSTP